MYGKGDYYLNPHQKHKIKGMKLYKKEGRGRKEVWLRNQQGNLRMASVKGFYTCTPMHRIWTTNRII